MVFQPTNSEKLSLRGSAFCSSVSSAGLNPRFIEFREPRPEALSWGTYGARNWGWGGVITREKY